VHTFSGHKIDVIRIGEICREKGIIFILNCSQAIGAFAVDVSRIPVDAIVCAGYKWMLGPYGTGFCWIKPEVRDTLQYNHAYWQTMLNESQLMSTEEIALSEHKSARNYDVFGTANFFNYAPWTASIQYMMKLGMDKVEQYNQQLVGIMLESIDQKQFKLISPPDLMSRSNLVVFSHQEPQRNETILNRLKEAGIFLALWKGNLRASAHIHNTRYDVEKFVKVLNRCQDESHHERSHERHSDDRERSSDRERHPQEGQEGAQERQERPDRPERQQRQERPQRHDRHGRHGRHDRHGRHGHQRQQGERPPQQERPSQERPSEERPSPESQSHERQPDDQPSDERSEG
jgi:hypothetical protein